MNTITLNLDNNSSLLINPKNLAGIHKDGHDIDIYFVGMDTPITVYSPNAEFLNELQDALTEV